MAETISTGPQYPSHGGADSGSGSVNVRTAQGSSPTAVHWDVRAYGTRANTVSFFEFSWSIRRRQLSRGWVMIACLGGLGLILALTGFLAILVVPSSPLGGAFPLGLIIMAVVGYAVRTLGHPRMFT